MNTFIALGNKLISILLIAALLQACGAGNNRDGSGIKADHKQSLAALIKQAQQASADKKSPLLVQAAGLLVLEERFEKSQELLIHVDRARLSPLENDDFFLYYGETLLGLNAVDKALTQLQSISQHSAHNITWQIRYAQSLANTQLANNNYFEAAKLRIELDDIIDDSPQLAQNNEEIWQALNQLESDFLQQMISDFNTKRVNGWLEIVSINKRWGYHPERLMSELAIWKQRYPLHPSSLNQPESLQRAATAEELLPKRIAILLPLTGQLASYGQMIHDGILAAHYQSPHAQTAPKLAFYDTAKSLSPLTPYQQALDEGADFILGPLTKESIESLLNQEQLTIPILALNQLEEQKFTHPLAFQFGLPVEDEAIQAAHYAFEKGHRKAIAFVPDNATGERAQQAFKEYFEQLGGELLTVQTYREKKQLKLNVQQLLGVDTSQDRKQDLERLLGRNLEFEMRRRQDADFIFLHARPEEGRMIKPFINYYFAHDLPVIATSSIFSGKLSPQKDIDLNGIEFPHIPLLLSQLDSFKQTRAQLKTSLPEALDARGRYFSLGFDSYKILGQLLILQAFPEYHWNGLSGELAVDEQGLVHRYLTWAQFNRGVPNVTKERDIKTLDSAILQLRPTPIDTRQQLNQQTQSTVSP